MKTISLAFAALMASAPLALAADAVDYVPAAPDAPAVSAGPAWTGVYVGVNGGMGGGTFKSRADVLDQGAVTDTGRIDAKASGFTGGVQAGANVQMGRAVFGVEGDVQKSNIKARVDATVTDVIAGTTEAASAEAVVGWHGSVRARAGALATDSTLVYGTGGYAFGRVRGDVSVGGQTATGRKTVHGWTAGAGVEQALSGKLSVKTEYLYTDLKRAGVSDVTAAGTGTRATVDPNFHTVRGGLNMRF